MSTTVSPMAKQICSKQDIQKTATGYISRFRVQPRRHVDDIAFRDIGDFNSAYTVKTSSHSEGGPSGMPRDHHDEIEAKWLGACKPDQKPGDIVMPGGFKLNVKDARKAEGPAAEIDGSSPRKRGEAEASHRHPHRGAQAAHRAVAERDVAAMRARDVAGDRKAQAGAALILVAGVVEPQERLEHFLAHFRRECPARRRRP